MEKKMTGFKVIQIAKSEIGVSENPPNSNLQKYGAWFGWNGVAWCAQFVSWCYATAGVPLGNIGFPKGFAGCQSAYSHFLKTKEITTSPAEGDIVLFDWNGDHRYDHTGLFVRWLDEKKGIFESIEGNTSLTNDSNGGKVMMRNRNKSVAVFVHPKILN
jgi:hypothetical protein